MKRLEEQMIQQKKEFKADNQIFDNKILGIKQKLETSSQLKLQKD